MNTELSAVEVVAVSKMIKTAVTSKASKNLAVGVHEVNALIRVQGSIKVGEDFEKRQTNTIDWMGLTAFALSKLNGVTIESLIAEYEANGVPKADIKKVAQDKVDDLRGTTWKTNNGPVTTDLQYEAVEELAEV
jgi:hypothetical protein